MLNKCAESKTYGSTAILIAFLIMFILFLVLAPTEYIDELDLTYTPEYSSIALLETPGSLYIQEDSQESETHTYDLTTITVDNFPKSTDMLLMHQGVIKNSLFNSEVLAFNFSFSDLERLDKVYFSANAINKIGSGEVIIYLNDVVIYSREIYKDYNLNIVLPEYLLRENNNGLKISVSSPGLAFWNTNAYVLSNIYLIKEEYSVNNQRSDIFFLDKDIVSDTKTAKFSSYVSKQGSNDASLEILINNNLIYSGIPSSRLDIQFPTSYLVQNSNQITVRTSRNGKYELRYIYLNLKTTKISDTANIARYSFTLDSKQWDKVNDTRYICELFLRKTSGLDNSVTVEVNNNLIRKTFDNNFTFTEDICDYLNERNNVIRLIPEDNVVVDLLKLEIKNK